VLLTSKDGKFAFLTGDGASEEGDRPFVDRIEIATGKTLRLLRSEAPYYEETVAILDPDLGRLITRRESASEPPNYYLRDLKKRGSQLTQLTRFLDPAPEFAGVTKQRITYNRADGVQLSATLYLPPGYDKSKGPLPFFFWAYPQEFRSTKAASQIVGSPYRFTRPSGASHLFLLLDGYGVLDGPTMPIVGEGDKEPNDTYVEQLVASAQAAVNKVVSMGVADPKRIGVGGHSYGAFMTVNLLAHSNIFRAGIARSGAYNRSLTPFGFQNEDRSYWEAQDVYNRMAPFNYADKIKEPLLMIHGMADDNTGTFPIQSERMFAALKGLGTKVRLVMLPAEAHGYRARESIGQTLFEMTSWLDRYVKPQQAMTP
jgi:dipeptidyl aminopeptidase/acylaminoacyl peptidase